MKDTQGNNITEEEFTKDIGHGVLLPDMTTQNETMGERFDEKWQDLSVRSGSAEHYDQLKFFIQSEIALAIDNRNREVVEWAKETFEFRGEIDYFRLVDFINPLIRETE